MRIGVAFPTDMPADPGAVKDFAQAAEDLGYSHILAIDLVVAMDPRLRPDWADTWNLRNTIREPFVLFSYLAGLTTRIGFATGVLVLPQRQTVLVAKQAAEVDVLSRGRLRLGVGLGWKPPEFEALGANFRDRAGRIEEQIEVLRALWTQESVTYRGRWHTIDAAGITPLPVQRPIPIWLGGIVEATVRRVARIGDGWMPLTTPEKAQPMIERLREYARAEGRDPAGIGIEAFIHMGQTPEDEWIPRAQAWQEIGVDYLTVTRLGAGLTSPQDHINTIRRFKEVLASSGIDVDTGHSPGAGE